MKGPEMTSRIAFTAIRDAKVGERGFEPPTSRTRTVRASLAALLPDDAWNYTHLCATMQISIALTLSAPGAAWQRQTTTISAGIRFDGMFGLEEEAAATNRPHRRPPDLPHLYRDRQPQCARRAGRPILHAPAPAGQGGPLDHRHDQRPDLPRRLLPPAVHQHQQARATSSGSGAGSTSSAACPSTPAAPAPHPPQLRPLVSARAPERTRPCVTRRGAGWPKARCFVVASLVVILVTFGGLAISLIEPAAPGANIKTGSDAVWYVIVTIATVGYGDRYPVTNQGRIVGVILMVARRQRVLRAHQLHRQPLPRPPRGEADLRSH